MTNRFKEIAIPRQLVQKILHHAQQTPEQEVCGLISSQNGTPYRYYPIKNTSTQPERFFNLDAQQQIQAMSNMRDHHEQLFAIYHSHPSAPAIPSRTDIQQANYPEALNLIISLDTKGIMELRAYQIDDAQFTEIPLRLGTSTE